MFKGVFLSWFVQVLRASRFRSEDQEERCLISSHLEERAGKEPRREEEMTKKESTSGTIQVLKVDSSVPRNQ